MPLALANAARYGNGNMIFNDALSLELYQLRAGAPSAPFCITLLRNWVAAGFDPAACRQALVDLMQQMKIESGFDPSEVLNGGCVTTNEVLFPERAPSTWSFTAFSRTKGRFESSIDPADLPEVAELIRDGVRGADEAHFRSVWEPALGSEVVSVLAGRDTETRNGRWLPLQGAGIYRREHASLLITSGTTSVLTDPQAFGGGWTTNAARYPAESNDLRPDVIAISHSHNDHWHLPSILRYAHEGTTVLLPRVPRVSLLTPEDMTACVAATALDAKTLDWWQSETKGDIVVRALPFYGEQPLRVDPALAPELRNWGNLYRFELPQFSAAVLVDSGSDPAGNAVDTIARSVAEDGPIDVILSCCFDFPEAINPGLPHYFLTVPFDILVAAYERRQRGQMRFMTLGVEGVTEVCRVAGARYFLPYAHGFSGIGRDPHSPEATTGVEKRVVESLREAFARASMKTEVLDWSPGDAALWTENGLKIVTPEPV